MPSLSEPAAKIAAKVDCWLAGGRDEAVARQKLQLSSLKIALFDQLHE